jgi:hypothetical protein
MAVRSSGHQRSGLVEELGASRLCGQEDGHRVVIGLWEELAEQRSDDVRLQITSKLAIIIMSSCSKLWQWKTYLPR